MSRLDTLLDHAGAVESSTGAERSFREAVMAHLDLDREEAGTLWSRIQHAAIQNSIAEAIKAGRLPWDVEPVDALLVVFLSGIHLGVAAERERWEHARRLEAASSADAPQDG